MVSKSQAEPDRRRPDTDLARVIENHCAPISCPAHLGDAQTDSWWANWSIALGSSSGFQVQRYRRASQGVFAARPSRGAVRVALMERCDSNGCCAQSRQFRWTTCQTLVARSSAVNTAMIPFSPGDLLCLLRSITAKFVASRAQSRTGNVHALLYRPGRTETFRASPTNRALLQSVPLRADFWSLVRGNTVPRPKRAGVLEGAIFVGLLTDHSDCRPTMSCHMCWRRTAIGH
jgi:hypothetical protein